MTHVAELPVAEVRDVRRETGAHLAQVFAEAAIQEFCGAGGDGKSTRTVTYFLQRADVDKNIRWRRADPWCRRLKGGHVDLKQRMSAAGIISLNNGFSPRAVEKCSVRVLFAPRPQILVLAAPQTTCARMCSSSLRAITYSARASFLSYCVIPT